ncbi:hypothetical protein [Pseudomonas caricapapayae]|uniref:hypothetical protein n=1 Tax=Pseudomonas caricapapayae TaxID=46678 RepID=UPI0011C39C2A|nr:hypothetical protein [Pseudomonas caricapapayae]
MPAEFEVTLHALSTTGDLVFTVGTSEYRLPIINGTVGESPASPSSDAEWRLQIGLRGRLSFTLHPTISSPALFSFCAYRDQSCARMFSLDDVNATTAQNFIGWRSYMNPFGFLAKKSSPVGWN